MRKRKKGQDEGSLCVGISGVSKGNVGSTHDADQQIDQFKAVRHFITHITRHFLRVPPTRHCRHSAIIQQKYDYRLWSLEISLMTIAHPNLQLPHQWKNITHTNKPNQLCTETRGR